MDCTSCGGGKRGVRRASGTRTSQQGMDWVHVHRSARVPYATEEQAKAAARLFGGEVKRRKDLPAK